MWRAQRPATVDLTGRLSTGDMAAVARRQEEVGRITAASAFGNLSGAASHPFAWSCWRWTSSWMSCTAWLQPDPAQPDGPDSVVSFASWF